MLFQGLMTDGSIKPHYHRHAPVFQTSYFSFLVSIQKVFSPKCQLTSKLGAPAKDGEVCEEEKDVMFRKWNTV
jgi:hypothetical protein